MPIARQETGLSLSRAGANPGSPTVWKGSCHCGRNRFEVKLPKIENAISCNCLLCRKSGYLWGFPEAGDIKYTKGDEDTLAGFETEALSHEFCNYCGTGLYGTHKAGPLEGQPGINIRAILDVNPFDLMTQESKTASVVAEDPIVLPEPLEKSLRSAELEGDNVKFYTGTCACGNVAFSVKTPPLVAVEVKEDNCSICRRRAAITIYPDRDQVTLVGKENTTTYAFGRKFNEAPFCKTCGVACYGVPIGPPQEFVDKLPEAKKEFVEKQRRIQPLYVRVMDGVEWDDIHVEQSDEGTEGYVLSDE